MDDHVVGEAGLHGAAVLPLEVPEQEGLVAAGVEGVGVGKGVWDHLDLVAETPADPPAECLLETGQRVHHDRVHVLRVEPPVADQLARITLGKRIDHGAVFVHRVLQRGVEGVGRGVEVDHLHPIAPGPFREVFGRQGHARGQDRTRAILDGRILGDDGEVIVPAGGWTHFWGP
jgi:hypothetical protein